MKKPSTFNFIETVNRLAKRTGIEHPENVIYDTSIVCDPITTIRIVVLKGFAVGVGYAICSKVDKFDPNIGLQIALARALRDLATFNRKW